MFHYLFISAGNYYYVPTIVMCCCHAVNRNALIPRFTTTIVPWVTAKGSNIKIVYPIADGKHKRLLVSTLQLALPEGTESIPNMKNHSLCTRCGVPQPLFWATKARDTKLWEMAAIRDFRLSTNRNIITHSSHSQLVQIGMKTTNMGIEDLNPPIRTWTWIWLDIATNNQQ